MGLFRKYINQTRKPEGILGKMMLSGMNSGHAHLADWGLSYLTDIAPEEIVDLGCGGGRNAGELLYRFSGCRVTAVDHSPLSVAKASAYNRGMVNIGRCIVREGDVSALALDDNSYDVATAFETVYFWPGLEKCFAEVFRILKPGGMFMIVNESDGTDKNALQYERIIDGMKCYTVEDLMSALKSAGFCEMQSYHHPSKPWITVTAEKART